MKPSAQTILLSALWGISSGLVFPGAASAADPPMLVSAQASTDAKVLREKGLEFFKKKDYVRAVEAFQNALALQRKAGAMAQMASALNALGRYDEALQWYEAVLAEFPQASAKLRSTVSAEMAELVAKVGTIAVEGDVVQGARLHIDNRDVGELPLRAPVRVVAGVHEVREEKPGFAPIIMSVSVTAGQASMAKMVAKERQAKLDIREKHNWVLHVELDGEDVGITPLPKMVTAGEHRIRLRGYMQPEALLACESPETPTDIGARMESEEKVVTLGLFETQIVELSAEDMDASLHIDAMPKGAMLWIDGHVAGKTPWEGRLRLGAHTIEVRAKGFLAAIQHVDLERRKVKEIAVNLEREPDLEAQRRADRTVKWGVGLAAGVAGVGLGMFAIAGGWALNDKNILQTNCPNQQCPSSEDDRLQEMATLGTVSTVGLVMAGLGAGGAAFLWYTRPQELRLPKPPTMGVGVGLGRMTLDVRF